MTRESPQGTAKDEPTPDQLEELLASVRAGRKYRNIDANLVRSIGAAELAKGRKLRDAIKATRSQLHQSAGAYHLGRMDYSGWITKLEQNYDRAGETARRELVLPMLSAHASTRERIPILTPFYDAIFSSLPPVRSVLDLACGLNPLAIPWMGLSPDIVYRARDIYQDQMDFVARFVELAGHEADVEQQDLLSTTSFPTADLALVLKTIPCLEQMDRNAGRHLLDNLQARHWAISFPVVSLGGRKKGMRENYSAHFAFLMEGRPGRIERFDFESELLYVVTDVKPK